MTTVPTPTDVAQILLAHLHAMTTALQRGDGLSVARRYADDALLTDLHTFRVQGRAALDAHWTSLLPCVSWHLAVLEVGGDPSLPYQRLASTLVLAHNDKEILDTGTCFVIWKRQDDDDYRIYIDIYCPAP
jgi:ketosteroid isomerase-like protein